MEKKPRVLISGAGIAGTTLAFWLSKAGIPVTVLEYAKEFRKEGQTVDIREEGLQVMEWMGIRKAISDLCTKEAGIKFVDSQNRAWASFPQREDGKSFSAEIEILRSHLAEIIFEKSKEKAEYKFGASIDTIEETENSVRVTLAQDKTIIECDILVLAEGLLSRNRAKVFNENVRAPVVPLDVHVAIFSYDQGLTDTAWARVYHMPKRRALLVRPDGFSKVRATVLYLDPSDTTRLIASSKTPQAQQKEYFVNLFKGEGWESDKILEGLRQSDDFYIQEIAQVKAKTWSKGRVVMVGDTAYCPSPLSGLGTTAAIIGSYVLASEIVKHQNDHQTSFSNYEITLRPWIKKVQKLTPGAPKLFYPNTIIGVYLFRIFVVIMSTIVNSKIFSFLQWILSFQPQSDKLPLSSPSTFDLQ
ncbi:hypothetical protein O181_029864 [Austropuccinia psidii MF-1]|uniref:FAD-binding domain-containing protein n=1 Tax=Austropuccinia psidii MF-1 TaxID=1389203 RepID=A0A9Q3H4Z7_9BASI|nr:hypothetical protein [Austropuccinia psidii MF-1]